MQPENTFATLADVQVGIAVVKKHVADLDDEQAHIAEEDLHRGVLRAIAEGRAENGVEMAKLALTTWDDEETFRFSRWCA